MTRKTHELFLEKVKSKPKIIKRKTRINPSWCNKKTKCPCIGKETKADCKGCDYFKGGVSE